jgi:hypothetical protein
MSDRESFSLRLGGEPSHAIPINLHLAIAFKDGGTTIISIDRNPLPKEGPDNETAWRECDPRRHPIPFPSARLSMEQKCQCRTPESRLKLHDMDPVKFLAYVEALIEKGDGVARFLLHIEGSSGSDDDEIIATMLTLALVQS